MDYIMKSTDAYEKAQRSWDGGGWRWGPKLEIV